MSNHSVTIKAAEHGPYIVEQLKNLNNRKGSIECKETMALCRCGASSNKPFCDGSHARIGFSSENQLDPALDKLENYQGKKITLHDNRSICAHAGYCTEALPSVFRQHDEPFVNAEAASWQEIMDVVDKCPSGALSYSIEDDDPTPVALDASVFIAPNGPYVIKGQAELIEISRGEGASPKSTTLCRCGASKNKPFCDGSHWQIEFKDDDN